MPTAEDPRLEKAYLRVKRDNRRKVLRTVLQITALVAALGYGIYAIVRADDAQRAKYALQTPAGNANVQAGGSGSHFIALSYPGLTRSTSIQSRIVNQDRFAEQLEALHASGYVTISQQDILNYYQNYGALPERALFLIFEDGLLSSVSLADQILERNGYNATLSTYSANLTQAGAPYITGEQLQSLMGNPRWEMGSGGNRLSYINVFDRYSNFFGALTLDQFLRVRTYLWRDYNHFLMDFERDADRLRTETEAHLRQRIAAEYAAMQASYQRFIGSVPQLYLLMHANTGAFGTDAIASDANREGILTTFAMNFNREGTCLNTLDSSIYDLSRLQVQSYFSTNHLLMRIWDDTGEPVAFVTGDTEEASHWYLDGGAAEYRGNEIILTSPPSGKALLTLKSSLFTDMDLSVTLGGNLVGRQSIYLRTDRTLSHGLEVALTDNNLEVWSLGEARELLFHQSLFELDGGPYISIQEDELNGLIAYQQAIIDLDSDPARVAAATARLQELSVQPVLTLADGGTPYYPVNDTATRGERRLRIRLAGQRLSVWVDDRPAVEQLKVDGVQLGSLGLGSAVFENQGEQFTQHNIYDDVYDAVFTDLTIADAENPQAILYEYRLNREETINTIINRWVNNVIDFFVDHF
ncbi:MAG: hypothetical protein VB087_08105 [Candidatus Limiplasma sp.]|nr:hypothetical protein [Candidatus Limiplasma sp.]MEA5144928.1 hypothetical protein [Candidatus Limiplasma sp.]